MEFMAIEVLLELLEDFLYTHRRWWLTYLSDFLIDLDMSHSHFFLAYDPNTRTEILFPRTYTGAVFFQIKIPAQIQENESFSCVLCRHTKMAIAKIFLCN